MRALSLVLLVLALPAGAQTRRFYYVPIQNGAGGGGTPTTRVIGTGTSSSTGLSGGGDLSADRSLACVQASTSSAGCVSTGTDAWAGNKSTTGTLGASNLSGSNTGDVTIGTFGSTPTANGALLSGQSLLLQPADGTRPGSISLSAQTMGAGTKTFSGQIASTVTSGNTAISTVAGAALDMGNSSGYSAMLKSIGTDYVRSDARWQFGHVTIGGNDITGASGLPFVFFTNLLDAAGSIAYQWQTNTAYATAGAKLMQWRNGQTNEVSSIDFNGSYRWTGNATLQTCAAGIEGLVQRDAASGLATAARTRLCVCTSNGSSVYAWQTLGTGTVGTSTTCSP